MIITSVAGVLASVGNHGARTLGEPGTTKKREKNNSEGGIEGRRLLDQNLLEKTWLPKQLHQTPIDPHGPYRETLAAP